MNEYPDSARRPSVREVLREVLREHPAVADAEVHAGPDGERVVARVVPDPETAALLHRSAVLQATGRLGRLRWHEPADGLRVAGLNRGETDFLYREIFTGNAYFRHGIGLPPGAIVVDAGANIGMFTLRAALESPGARIIAVEPLTELADAIEVNTELHGVDVTVLRTAIGGDEGKTEFTFYPHNSVMSGKFADPHEDFEVLKGYLLTGDGSERSAPLDRLVVDRMAAEHRSVPVTTLDRVAEEYGLTRIDLLKIDVERAEEEVLKGIGDALWPRIDRLVMEVHDIDGRLDAVLGRLRAEGFEVEHDQDPRMSLTSCHNVYARRPEAAGPSRPADVPRFGGGPTLRVLERELRELLARRLPRAAAPGRFEVVPDLEQEAGDRPGPSASPGSVATSRTAVLAGIWRDLFGAEAVRPDADFFDLGGDSLTAVRLLARVEELLGEDALTPDLIFTDGTLGALATAIEASARSGPEEHA
jgi:FkbM family methyltransferase